MMLLATRIFAGLMAALFVLSAALQYNDPDPLMWIAIYGAATVVSGLHVAGRGSAKAAYVLAAVSLVWAVTLFPEFIGRIAPGDLVLAMKAERPEIEAAREAGGLLIVTVTMLVVALAASSKSKATVATAVSV